MRVDARREDNRGDIKTIFSTVRGAAGIVRARARTLDCSFINRGVPLRRDIISCLVTLQYTGLSG